MKRLKHSIRDQGKLLRDSSKLLLKNGVKAGFQKLCAIQPLPRSNWARAHRQDTAAFTTQLTS